MAYGTDFYSQQQPMPAGGNPLLRGPQRQMVGMPSPGMQQQPMQGAQPGTGGLDQGTVDAILAMQQMAPQQAAIARQQKLADMMRGQAGSQLEGRQAGRMYAAPGWANLAANIAQQYQANKMSERADLSAQNLGAQRADAMRKYFNAVTGRKERAMSHMGDEGE